jgi:hypothetical protein|tara:strand:- start:22687 stop:22977 length:291 start_codon:yes stop_codon:yes gene_type:complete
MKKSDITIDNVHNFLVGNLKYYKSKVITVPDHIKEQLQHRLDLCGDCIEAEGCIKCGCPVVKKHFLKKSCNPERFPDLMEKEEWDEYKKTINGKTL